MHAKDVREKFTGYFEAKDHARIQSSNLVPNDDSLLFVNSGMVQFKPYFLGEEKPPHPRAVTVQKCVRAGGKHNDLDEVGRTTRHLTFFEMLGNFSFGDYFKEEAMAFAWQFVTTELNLDPERLWVTVHVSDDEAEALWRDKIGVPQGRIQRLDEDNWWRMADTGPNGPCSEIFWDKGPQYGADGGPAQGDEDRFIEIWNLVFMQFATSQAGQTTPLPSPSVDTGAGLERLLSILQGVESVFEIDEMARLVGAAEAATGFKLGASDQSDLALRVLAEHARTMTFLISDGVMPSNEDRGYVLRRIMRRAVRFAYMLGTNDVVTPKLVESVVSTMAPAYPELADAQDTILSVVEREEVQFRRTLETGSNTLSAEVAKLPQGAPLSGSVAFNLHDTFGFPVELTEEILSESDTSLDRTGFDEKMAEQRQRSKSAATEKGTERVPDAVQLLVDSGNQTDFVGRTRVADVSSSILAVTSANENNTWIVLGATPFYAEAGGQVGDTGIIEAGVETVDVVDAQYLAPGIVGHLVKGKVSLGVGDSVTASIDVDRRDSIRRNHTGTHIIHWALRKVLGDHVKQQGSLVAPDRFRFDFAHFEQLTAEQIAEIEDLANREILANPPTTHEEMTKQEASEMGALSFFGDNYGERVRVLSAGPSLEFCGGTHVTSLGDIGCVKITSESSIGSNIRRIEGVTGTNTIELVRSTQATLEAAANVLRVGPADLIGAVKKKNAQISDLSDQLAAVKSQLVVVRSKELAGSAVDGVLVTRINGLERSDVAELVKHLVTLDEVKIAVVGCVPSGGGAALACATEHGLAVDAGELISEAAVAIAGGGGKGKDFAMAGGKSPEGIEKALEMVRAKVSEV